LFAIHYANFQKRSLPQMWIVFQNDTVMKKSNRNIIS